MAKAAITGTAQPGARIVVDRIIRLEVARTPTDWRAGCPATLPRGHRRA
jgi:hypothetical protein